LKLKSSVWTTDAWRRRLLCLDKADITDDWNQVTAGLGENVLNAGVYSRMLQRLFAGRLLADLCVPGIYWQSGLFFCLLPILHGVRWEKIADAVSIPHRRFKRLMKGLVIPEPDELDTVLTYSRSKLQQTV